MRRRPLTTESVACYQRGIKLRQFICFFSAPTLSVFCFSSSQSDLATPQAESKLEDAEGSGNQARWCQANTPNHGLLRGGARR